MKKFLVKAAWIADHDSLGRVLSLLVTAYRETSPNSYGYSLSDDLDEVIIVPTYFNKAVEILPKMDKIGTKQFWKKAAFGDIAEIQLNMDDFSTITLIKTSGIEKSYFIHIKNCYKIIIVFKNSTDFGCIFCNIVNKKRKC